MLWRPRTSLSFESAGHQINTQRTIDVKNARCVIATCRWPLMPQDGHVKCVPALKKGACWATDVLTGQSPFLPKLPNFNAGCAVPVEAADVPLMRFLQSDQ